MFIKIKPNLILNSSEIVSIKTHIPEDEEAQGRIVFSCTNGNDYDLEYPNPTVTREAIKFIECKMDDLLVDWR